VGACPSSLEYRDDVVSLILVDVIEGGKGLMYAGPFRL